LIGQAVTCQFLGVQNLLLAELQY